jgi:protein phosphatase
MRPEETRPRATDTDPEITAVPPAAPPTLRARVEFGALTDPGKVRPNNEDQFLVARLTKTFEVLATSLSADAVPRPPEPEGYLLVVADGIGGAAAGERASALAVQEGIHHVVRTAKWFFSLDDPCEEFRLQAVRETLERLDRQLVREAEANPALTGMGTTLTAASIVGAELFVVHVGDSRAYLLRRGRLEQVTRDHTLAQTMVDAGWLNAEEARTSRMRSVLTNAIGGQPGVRAEIHQLRLADGDRVLLCTDGLTDRVEDGRIAELLAAHPRPDQACRALVEAALEAGGRDNVTVVVANCAIAAA